MHIAAALTELDCNPNGLVSSQSNSGQRLLGFEAYVLHLKINQCVEPVQQMDTKSRQAWHPFLWIRGVT